MLYHGARDIHIASPYLSYFNIYYLIVVADGDLDDDDTPLDLSQFSDQLNADDDIQMVDR